MQIIEWRPKYSVGVEEIDNQHKKLIGMVNQMIEAKNEGHEQDVMVKILREIVDYTHYHFDSEEEIMAVKGYPGVHEHKAQHNVLRKQIAEILKELKYGNINVSNDLYNILRNWLLKHVLDHDKQYGRYTNID